MGTMERAVSFTEKKLVVWRDSRNQVPGSKRLLKSTSLQSQKMRFFINDRFQNAGIDPERVIIESSSKDYMLRYLDMDIAFDTYPYCGGGTTVEAM